MDEMLVLGCRLLPSKLPQLHWRPLALTIASVLQDRGQILVLGCRLLPSKLPRLQ